MTLTSWFDRSIQAGCTHTVHCKVLMTSVFRQNIWILMRTSSKLCGAWYVTLHTTQRCAFKKALADETVENQWHVPNPMLTLEWAVRQADPDTSHVTSRTTASGETGRSFVYVSRFIGSRFYQSLGSFFLTYIPNHRNSMWMTGIYLFIYLFI